MKKANQYAVDVYKTFSVEAEKQEQAIEQQCEKFGLPVKRTRKSVLKRTSKLCKYWIKAGGALATFPAQQEQQK